MRAPHSRTALVVTLLAFVAAAVIAVLAVVVVIRDVRDDAAWVAFVLGLAVATWALWFHSLSADGSDGRPVTAVTGAVATGVILGGGAYWILRVPLDRSVSEALVVTVIVLGLRGANRIVDAGNRRRRAVRDGGA